MDCVTLNGNKRYFPASFAHINKAQCLLNDFTFIIENGKTYHCCSWRDRYFPYQLSQLIIRKSGGICFEGPREESTLRGMLPYNFYAVSD
jgi:hypothetical protein